MYSSLWSCDCVCDDLIVFFVVVEKGLGRKFFYFSEKFEIGEGLGFARDERSLVSYRVKCQGCRVLLRVDKC
jgi:hypothetical protein